MIRILNLFDCPLNDARMLLPKVSEQGFNALQISPLQRTKNDDSHEWWMLYQPLNFEIGNRLGSKEDLYNLCNEASKYGIIIIADVVVNHMANEPLYGELIPHPWVDRELRDNPYCWKERRNVTDWNDRYQVTHYCMGLPGLNPNHPLVQEKVIKMLNEYIDLGVNGFRFDAAKSIALPEEGCNFFPIITYSLKKYLPIIYGEVLFADEELINKYIKYMKVLTNSDSWNKDGIIKFTENKDSYLSKDLGWTRYYSKDRVTDEYQYLSNIYPNTKYYARNYTDDWYEWQNPRVKEANLSLAKRY